jgi:hypothetical protein
MCNSHHPGYPFALLIVGIIHLGDYLGKRLLEDVVSHFTILNHTEDVRIDLRLMAVHQFPECKLVVLLPEEVNELFILHLLVVGWYVFSCFKLHGCT